MVKALIIKNARDEICSFEISGHAGYSKSGSDIVCAAVSVLVLNTINAISRFTGEKMELSIENEGGFIKSELPDMKIGKGSHDALLLLKTLELGLLGIEEEYKKNLQITVRRC